MINYTSVSENSSKHELPESEMEIVVPFSKTQSVVDNLDSGVMYVFRIAVRFEADGKEFIGVGSANVTITLQAGKNH